MPSHNFPLVLIHGLWNTPQLFRPLLKRLEPFDFEVVVPHLPHKFGRVPISQLAENLDGFIVEKLGQNASIYLLGFSMGGLVARAWLQNFGGAFRTKKFISVGTPHLGTLSAQLVPKYLFEGISDMKRASPFLRDLDQGIHSLQRVKCISFYTPWDLMVFPGWDAILSTGAKKGLPVLTHKQLISHSNALDTLIEELINY